MLLGLRRIAFTVLLGGFLCASLVRFAPGFDVDEEQLDARRSEGSRQRLRETRQAGQSVVAFYLLFLKGYLSGHLGSSILLRRPVAELLSERAAPTVIGALTGLAGGWTCGLWMAVLALRFRNVLVEGAATATGVFLQCVPVAVVALCLLYLGGRGPLVCGAALGATLYPRIIHFVRNILRQSYESAHVLAARAKGLGEWRVLFRHVLPVSAPQLLSLFGVSVSLILSAAIPMEMILDVPGIGQLAWQAALARDLNVLVNITVLMSVIITVANTVSEALGNHLSGESAGVR